MYNRIVDKTKYGILVYGTSGGFTELGSHNLENTNYLEDFPFITYTLNLADTNYAYSIISKNGVRKYTIFSGGLNRNGFFSISILFEGKTPKAEVVFEKLNDLANTFRAKFVITTSDFKVIIAPEKKPEISNLIKSFDFSNNDYLTVGVRQLSGNFLCRLNTNLLKFEKKDSIYDFLESYIYESMYFAQRGQIMSSILTFNKENEKIEIPLKVLDQEELISQLERERLTKRFSFKPLSRSNTLVPGILNLNFGNEQITGKRIDTINLPVEIVVDESTNGTIEFIPDDQIRYQNYTENGVFQNLKGNNASTFEITIPENIYKEITINTTNVYGLTVKCNNREIAKENGVFKIFDTSGDVAITSSSHQIFKKSVLELKDKEPITLISNNIKIELIDGKNIIPLSNDIELTINGKRIYDGVINRNSLPAEIKVKTKNYIVPDALHIPMGDDKEKYQIKLGDLKTAAAKNGKSGAGKNSGVIEADKKTSWYSSSMFIAAMITFFIFALIGGSIWAYFYFSNEKVSCETINAGTPGFIEYCKTDTICQKCKKIENVQDEQILKDSLSAALSDTINQEVETVKKDTSKVAPEPDKNPSAKPEEPNCNNIGTRSKTERKKFCADQKNKKCPKCISNCVNYENMTKESQEAYCKKAQTDCEKCPQKVKEKDENVINTPETKNFETPKECSVLEKLDDNKLKDRCKNKTYQLCPKCEPYIKNK